MSAQTARSRHGCWTCRLRKKKCDETRPSCSICEGLKLMCYGYASRPDWMDGGELEREQAMHIKQMVKENMKKRLYYHYQEINSPQTGWSPRPLSWPPKLCGLAPTISNSPNSSPSFASTLDSSRSNTDTPRDPVFNNQDTPVYPSDQTLARTFTMTEEEWLESPIRSPVGVRVPLLCSSNSPGRNDSWVDRARVETNNDIPVGPRPSTPFQGQSGPLDNATVDNPTNWVPSSHEFSSTLGYSDIDRLQAFGSRFRNDSIPTDTEVALFMHYLDHVFYLQFPFYDSSAINHGRGWLFGLLMRDKSVYHAALALSQYHQHSTTLKNRDTAGDIALSQDKNEYYILALRELQGIIQRSHKWSGTAGLIQSVQALTCSLYLLFFEVFNGATGAWQMHLQAAATLAPQMVNAQLPLSEDGSAHLTSQRRLEDLAVLSCEDHTTITLLLGSFIWFDILACASTGSRPFLALDHILILEGDRIHLEELMGCENWVMIVIFQISELDHWKKDSERNCKLSIAELAKRGALIEACLQQRLEKIAVRDTSQNDDISGATLRFSKCTRTIITEIFALAALTYLHVVISGANPGVPEIIESVSRTVTAFKALSDARMLRWLVWPFCVTGCLVSEEDESVFRGLISAGKLSEKTVGTCIEAVKLIEECWKRRQTGLGNCDWVSVMHSLGNLILLG